MCYYSDLFGDIIVLKSDISLFLQTNPIMQGRSKKQVEYYVKNFDIVHKIKLMKLNDTFKNIELEKLSNQAYDLASLDFLDTQYVKDLDEKKPACPDWFHICTNLQCVVFMQQMKREKNRAKYLKRKN